MLVESRKKNHNRATIEIRIKLVTIYTYIDLSCEPSLLTLIDSDTLLCKTVFVYSIETFVSEVETEYSKLKLWISNSEIADSWLMEYEPYADKPEKLGTTIRLVRTQLHENQVSTAA